MLFDFSKKVILPEHVVLYIIEGEAVILNIESERHFGLEEVGTRMWEVLSTSETIEKGFAQLRDEYNVEPEVLRADLQELLERMMEYNLIEIVD